MRQQSEGLETFSQNFLSALWWLAKLFRTRYQNVFICSFKTNTAKISISSEVWVIFCKFWSKAVKVETYWMLFAKKSWDQLIPIKGWEQLIAKKDNALFVIRSKTEASIVGLLSQTWGVSFDGRSGKERFPLESFLADK